MNRMLWKPWQWKRVFWKALSFGFGLFVLSVSQADEGGVSFWVPGFFGSLAAVPLQPGFSLTTTYYHTTIEAGSNIAFARQVTAARIKSVFTGNLNQKLNANADFIFATPGYTLTQSFLGGQATIMMAVPYGRSEARVNSTLAGNFGLGHGGIVLGNSRRDQISGIGDFAPMFNLRWNAGVHNYMTYLLGNINLGVYNPNNLTNLGLNHKAVDTGGGYTYYDKKTGREFSSVLGFTYNFPNKSTQYQNGVVTHLDLGASQFLTPKVQMGMVGYAYQQLSCDKGEGDKVGCFKSRIFGAGPQIGYIIKGSNHQAYFNLKGYKEFYAEHRAQGWNAWLTLSISPTPR